jgi:transposase
MELAEIQALPENAQEYIQSLETKVELLTEELRLALLKRFGRSSEKLVPEQPELFEETPVESEVETEQDEYVSVPAHKRKKGGRKPLDPNLPREIIIHDIPEEEKLCGCGAELVKIDEVVTERLQVIPEQLYVERHIRPKYACRHYEGSGDEEKPVFRIAPAAPSILPGSIVTSGLLAFILVNKFCDHLPFYRQEKRFERIGVRISRHDMSNWMSKVYEKLSFMEELFKKKLKEGPVIQMDETTVQVLNEPERPDTRKSYMWLARGGPPKAPLVFYEYHETRSSEHAKNFLDGYSGYLQTDGYKGYDAALKENEDIIHVGCLAHARRKFVEAAGASKKAGSAEIAIKKIRDIYLIEKELREKGLEEEEFAAQRKAEAGPLLEDLKIWLDDKAEKIRPTSLTGEAVRYTLGQWEKIVRYLECAHLTPDNNAAERGIKPFVVGRKNWLFAGSPDGAKASSLFFSLIETAKENNLNPYGYLKWIFDQAAVMDEHFDRENLLPWNCDREEVQRMAFAPLGHQN